MPLKLDRRAFVGTALAFGALCSVSPAQAFGVTAAQKKAEVQSVKAKLDSMSDEVEIAAEKYNAATIAYDKATKKVKANQKKIDAAQKKIKTLQGHLETRATAMYRSGSMSYLDVLLGSASFGDFATVWDTLNNLNQDDADLVSETKVTKQELETAKKDLADQQAEAKKQLNAANEAKNEAEQKQAAYEREYNSLSAEYQELVEKERQAEEEAAARAAQAYAPTGPTASSSDSDDGGNDDGDDDGGSSSSSSSSSSSGGSSVHYAGSSAVAARAYAELGKPYKWGAVGPSSYDCSGLVSYCVSGSHTRIYTASELWGHARAAEAEGTPVACSSHHCGIAIGGGRMIHAPQTGDVVKISSLRGHCVVP